MLILNRKTILEGMFKKFIAKGKMPTAITDAWQQICSAEKSMKRSYRADFEIYGAKSQNGANAQEDVFVGLK